MLSALSKHSAYRILCTILWFLVLVGLPLTSFPLLSRLTGAIVAPFSFIPLVLLIVVWLVPYLVEVGAFPAEVIPYLYFVLVAVAISALAFFLDGQYLLDKDFFDQSLRAFITVAIGLAFYLVFSAYPRDEKTIRLTLLFLYVGGLLLIGWALFETVLLRIYERPIKFPSWVLSFKEVLSVQSINVFYSSRLSGFAYEPSWFARQFNLVFLPIWLASSFQRNSILKIRFGIFQIEDFLLLFGIFIFGLSSPRIGLVAFLASIGFVGWLFYRKMNNSWLSGIKSRKKTAEEPNPVKKTLLNTVLIIFLISIVTFSLFGFLTVASRWDERYRTLLEETEIIGEIISGDLTETGILELAKEFTFMERLIYWFGGGRIFRDYPLGVGLGNSGFYFFSRINGMGYESPEIRDLLYRANYTPNTKNLWVRLLAETGFIGFAVFLVWLFLLWRSASLIRKSESSLMKLLGLAGQLFLLAYLVEGFSMDSFAMPYQWVMTGLISAGGWMVRRELRAKAASKSIASKAGAGVT